MTAARTPADAERWMRQGTVIFADALAGLDDVTLLSPAALDGWTGRHLVAHLAANAEALSRLVQWAATGWVTPMYASPAQREADIEAGATRAAPELRTWFESSAARLADGYGSLSAEQRASQVRTAQGRLVPAAEIAWLRSREVMVHAIDLGTGLTFADLPRDFLTALVEDIVAKRSAGGGTALLLVCDDVPGRWTIAGDGEPIRVVGPLAEIAAYLAGRPSAIAGTAPLLPRWL